MPKRNYFLLIVGFVFLLSGAQALGIWEEIEIDSELERGDFPKETPPEVQKAAEAIVRSEAQLAKDFGYNFVVSEHRGRKRLRLDYEATTRFLVNHFWVRGSKAQAALKSHVTLVEDFFHQFGTNTRPAADRLLFLKLAQLKDLIEDLADHENIKVDEVDYEAAVAKLRDPASFKRFGLKINWKVTQIKSASVAAMHIGLEFDPDALKRGKEKLTNEDDVNLAVEDIEIYRTELHEFYKKYSTDLALIHYDRGSSGFVAMDKELSVSALVLWKMVQEGLLKGRID